MKYYILWTSIIDDFVIFNNKDKAISAFNDEEQRIDMGVDWLILYEIDNMILLYAHPAHILNNMLKPIVNYTIINKWISPKYKIFCELLKCRPVPNANIEQIYLIHTNLNKDFFIEKLDDAKQIFESFKLTQDICWIRLFAITNKSYVHVDIPSIIFDIHSDTGCSEIDNWFDYDRMVEIIGKTDIRESVIV